MIELTIQYQDDRVETTKANPPFFIGRGQDCQVMIHHWKVAKKHVRIERVGHELFAHDMGSLLGTLVNDRRIASYGPINSTDRMVLGPCLIQFTDCHQAVREQDSDLTLEVPKPHRFGVLSEPSIANVSPQVARPRRSNANPLFAEMHTELLKAFDLRKLDVTQMAGDSLRDQATRYLMDTYQNDKRFEDVSDLSCLIHQVVEESLGLGLISDLLSDASVSEIMVNRFDDIYVERDGSIIPYPDSFSSEAALKVILDRIIAPVGRRLDDASPMVDARLPDGSRLNAVLSPIAVNGISLTVRKFGGKTRSIPSLVEGGFIDAGIAKYLEKIIHNRLNILVSGGTGSGKTSLLNVLGNAIAAEQRVVTIEDSAELRLSHPHVVALEARPANTEGTGAITIRDLVKNALRMRPDRIIVGEVRGVEALDMVMALNTGHDGSFTTMHANNPRDALKRLEALVLLAAPNLPLTAIKELIASAFQVIVQIKRAESGHRRVIGISEIVGFESGTFLLQPFVHWDDQLGRFVYSNLPSAYVSSQTLQSV